MKELILIEPTSDYENQAKEYINEFKKENIIIAGGSDIDKFPYHKWLKKLELEKSKETCQKDRVPAHTYFLIRLLDNKIIGIINIRHELNDYLFNEGGHIGYSIRNTERRKGYATKMLELGLEKCLELGIKRALVTCDKNNIGSIKTILNNFGILENEYYNEGEITQRYWINIEEALLKQKNTYLR